MRSFVLFMIIIAAASGSLAQDKVRLGKSYPDGHGGQVHFPLGDLSFADVLLRFEEGKPVAKFAQFRSPDAGLGPPDYRPGPRSQFTAEGSTGYVTLGCGGVVVYRFQNNALVDVEGPDLYVFEVGVDIEPTRLDISQDGETWLEVGKISGGRADVDITSFVKPGEVFHYVKLTDLKSKCASRWPGADIDAVGAIGSALKITLEGSVLFEFNKYDLTAEALEALDRIADQFRDLDAKRVVVEGHTDAIGDDAYNLELSRKRADSVKTYLAGVKSLSGVPIDVYGYGESRPVANNVTDSGRAENRRVELIVFPGRSPE